MRSSASHSSRGCLDLTITSSLKPLSQGLVTFSGLLNLPGMSYSPALYLFCFVHTSAPHLEPPIWSPRAPHLDPQGPPSGVPEPQPPVASPTPGRSAQQWHTNEVHVWNGSLWVQTQHWPWKKNPTSRISNPLLEVGEKRTGKPPPPPPPLILGYFQGVVMSLKMQSS